MVHLNLFYFYCSVFISVQHVHVYMIVCVCVYIHAHIGACLEAVGQCLVSTSVTFHFSLRDKFSHSTWISSSGKDGCPEKSQTSSCIHESSHARVLVCLHGGQRPDITPCLSGMCWTTELHFCLFYECLLLSSSLKAFLIELPHSSSQY